MTAAPAARLLAAADILDKRASEATEGPWAAEGEMHEFSGLVGYDVDASNGGYLTRLATEEDARYIATMHPEVGKAVASLLRYESAMCGPRGRGTSDSALSLADLILAGAE